MRTPFLLLLAGCFQDSDVQFVALSTEALTLDTATARIESFDLMDCDGNWLPVAFPGEIDLLADTPLPSVLPGGQWCGVGLAFSETSPALRVDGVNGNIVVDFEVDPVQVQFAQEFKVDGEEWVWVLDTDRWLVESGVPAGTVEPDDETAQDLVDALPEALWFGQVWEARDEVYIDLWPFPDINFHIGVGNVETGAPGGCNGSKPTPDTQADTNSSDTSDETGNETGSDTSNDTGGGGGSSNPQLSGCESSGRGCNDPTSGCDCSGSSSSSDCDGDCSGNACSTLGFVPPLTYSLFGILFARRRRNS